MAGIVVLPAFVQTRRTGQNALLYIYCLLFDILNFKLTLMVLFMYSSV